MTLRKYAMSPLVWISLKLIPRKLNGPYLTTVRVKAKLTVGNVFTTKKSSRYGQKILYVWCEREDKAHPKAEVSIFRFGGCLMQTSIFHIKSFNWTIRLFLWVCHVHRQANWRCFICLTSWKTHLAGHAKLHLGLSSIPSFTLVTTAHAVFR